MVLTDRDEDDEPAHQHCKAKLDTNMVIPASISLNVEIDGASQIRVTLELSSSSKICLYDQVLSQVASPTYCAACATLVGVFFKKDNQLPHTCAHGVKGFPPAGGGGYSQNKPDSATTMGYSQKKLDFATTMVAPFDIKCRKEGMFPKVFQDETFYVLDKEGACLVSLMDVERSPHFSPNRNVNCLEGLTSLFLTGNSALHEFIRKQGTRDFIDKVVKNLKKETLFYHMFATDGKLLPTLSKWWDDLEYNEEGITDCAPHKEKLVLVPDGAIESSLMMPIAGTSSNNEGPEIQKPELTSGRVNTAGGLIQYESSLCINPRKEADEIQIRFSSMPMARQGTIVKGLKHCGTQSTSNWCATSSSHPANRPSEYTHQATTNQHTTSEGHTHQATTSQHTILGGQRENAKNVTVLSTSISTSRDDWAINSLESAPLKDSSALLLNVDMQPTKPRISRKRVERTWSEADMVAAMEAHHAGMSMRACSRKWGMSLTALSAWLEGRTTKKRKGPATVLTAQEENAIVSWCFGMQEAGMGITVHELCLKVAEVCQTRTTPFTNGIPGKSWWDGFRKRHPELQLRVAEPLEHSKAANLHLKILGKFYDSLDNMYNLHHYPPSNIWSVDEMGIQGSKDRGMKLLVRTGSRKVYGPHPDSGEWCRILCCVNAAGKALPGYYVFKRKQAMQNNLSQCEGAVMSMQNYLSQCEGGAVMSMQHKPWMTGELLLQWLDHFKSAVSDGVSPMKRHLLIVDGYISHSGLDFVKKGREWGIDVVTLPAHTSHKLQPLEVSVFKSFKSNFNKERSIWLMNNSCPQVLKSDLAGISSRALVAALTESNIQAGFRATGIWPLNRNALCFDNIPCNDNTLVCEVQHAQMEEDGVTEATAGISPDLHIPKQQHSEIEVVAALSSLSDSVPPGLKICPEGP